MRHSPCRGWPLSGSTPSGCRFDGEYYKTVGATIYDTLDAPIPVYIAAGGPVVARYAGRAGERFICTSGKGMELYTDELLPAAADALPIEQVAKRWIVASDPDEAVALIKLIWMPA